MTRYSTEYYKKNKEKLLEYAKKYREARREECAAKTRDYYRKNKESVTKRSKKWKKENAVRHRYIIKASHARAKLMDDSMTADLIQSVYEDNIKKYGTLTCVICTRRIEFGDDTLEHNIPLSKGGTHTYSNLGVAHSLCNNKKRSKTLEEVHRR